MCRRDNNQETVNISKIKSALNNNYLKTVYKFRREVLLVESIFSKVT